MTNYAKAETGCFESLRQTEVLSVLHDVTKSHHPLGGRHNFFVVFFFLRSSQCQIKHQSRVTEIKITLMIYIIKVSVLSVYNDQVYNDRLYDVTNFADEQLLWYREVITKSDAFIAIYSICVVRKQSEIGKFRKKCPASLGCKERGCIQNLYILTCLNALR